jgi:hypothetical protein
VPRRGWKFIAAKPDLHELKQITLDRLVQSASDELATFIDQGLDPTDPGYKAMLEKHLEMVLEGCTDYPVLVKIFRDEDGTLRIQVGLAQKLDKIHVEVVPFVPEDQE